MNRDVNVIINRFQHWQFIWPRQQGALRVARDRARVASVFFPSYSSVLVSLLKYIPSLPLKDTSQR